MQDDLHYRKVMSAPSIERQGLPPRRIEWRGGQMELLVADQHRSAADNDIVLREILVEESPLPPGTAGAGIGILIDLSQDGTIANSGKINGPFRLSQGDTIRIGKDVAGAGIGRWSLSE